MVVSCDFLRIIFDFLYCYNLSLENFFEVTFLTFSATPRSTAVKSTPNKPLRKELVAN